MVNNLEQIKSLLTFETSDVFYFLQILKRRKENPDMKGDVMLIKTYYITSSDHLERLFGEVKLLCDYHNARAYFSLNQKSFKKCAFYSLKEITDCLLHETYKKVKNTYTSVVGQTSGARSNKTWIIDVDIVGQEGTDEVDRIKTMLGELYVTTVQTKNGFHVICKPHNPKEYQFEHDVHKNNPTILYVA